MYVDAWTIAMPEESPVMGAENYEEMSPFAVGRSFELRECDLTDLPEDAQDAVILAGTLLLAYLEEARRLPQA